MRVSCPQYIPTPSCRRSPTAPPQEIPWHSARPRIRTRYPLLNQDRHAPPHAASPIGRLAIGRDERLVDGRRGLPNRRREGRADLGYVNLGLTAEHATVDEKPSDSEVLKRTSSAQRKLLSNKDRSPERSLSISRNELDRNARCLPNSATFRHFEPAPLLNQGWNRPFAVEPGSEGARPGGAAPGRAAGDGIRGHESTTMTMLPSANSYCDGSEFQRPGHMSSAFPEARRERPETARNEPRNCHGHRFAPTIPAFPANPGSTAKSPAGSTKRRAGENAGQKPFQTYQAHSRTLTLHAKRPPRHRPARRKSKTARRDRRAVRHMLLRLSLTPGRRPYAARRPCRCAPT